MNEYDRTINTMLTEMQKRFDELQLHFSRLRGFIQGRQDVYANNRDNLKIIKFEPKQNFLIEPAIPHNTQGDAGFNPALAEPATTTIKSTNKSALEFTDKEILKMPKAIRDKFKVGRIIAHVRLRDYGTYEVRCTYQKTAITGSGKTVAQAKERFIKKLNALFDSKGYAKPSKKIVLFNDFATQWFETVKKPTVKFNTYKSLLSTYNVHIKKFFAGIQMREITPFFIQPLFNKLDSMKFTRAIALVKLLLNQIFNAAIGEGIIVANPMRSVKVLIYETVKGDALTYAEEFEFLRKIYFSRYRLSFLFLLYIGMRRSELKTLKFEGDFAIVQTSKRKKTQKPVFRKIPITPMLKPHIEDMTSSEFDFAINVFDNTLTHEFKKLCPNHHLHELRHTFITRCQECGVQREVVSVWAGHAADKTMTSTVYTHFSDEFMLEKGQLINYINKLNC